MTTARLQRQLCDFVRASVGGGNSRPPEAGRSHWSIFIELHEARQWTNTAPQPIAYSEIRAYADLRVWPLRPQDVEIIRAMDTAYLTAMARMIAGKPDYTNAQPLSAAAFDAVFG